MPVVRMQAEMPNAEWERWQVYYGRVAQRREIAAKSRF